jgi:hypothetical protein
MGVFIVKSLKMKSSMALFVAIAAIGVFSLLGVHVIETKNITHRNQNISQLQHQAMLHIDFFTQLLKRTALNGCPPSLNYRDEHFIIKAKIHYIQHNVQCSQGTAKVDLFVQYKYSDLYPINLHHRFMKQF